MTKFWNHLVIFLLNDYPCLEILPSQPGLKLFALLHQVVETHGKVYTSDSLLETVLFWGLNCFFLSFRSLFLSIFVWLV